MLKNNRTIQAVFMGSVVAIMLAGQAAADAPEIGVLSLLKNDVAETVSIDMQALEALDCNVQRTGQIFAAQGDVKLETPDHYVLLGCNSSVITNEDGRKKLGDLAPGLKSVGMLEGSLTHFSVDLGDSKMDERQYVLKIGYYNDKNVAGRDTDLAELSDRAAKLPDTYVTEAFLGVNHAVGLPTPDEVVVLSYSDAAAADRFRGGNPKLMKAIGQFNKDHLVAASYYVGTAVE